MKGYEIWIFGPESVIMLENTKRKEGNIAKDKIATKRIGGSLIPQVPPDIFSLPGKGLSIGMKPEDEKQTSFAFIPEAKSNKIKS